jgi:hypothetical protein
MGVNVLYVTFARMARRVRRVVGVQVGVAVLILTLTDVLIRPLGITGAGVAFAGGEAIMAFIVLPSVVRQYKHPDMAPSFGPDAVLVARGAEGGGTSKVQSGERTLQHISGAEDEIPLSYPDSHAQESSLPVSPSRGRDIVTLRSDGVAWKGSVLHRPLRYVQTGIAPGKLRVRNIVSMTLLVADLVVLGMTIGDFHGPVRLVLGLVLGAVIPGWSVVGLLRLRNAALEAALTVAVSFALLMVAAQILLTVHAWHLDVLEEATSAVCLPSLIWQSLRARGTLEDSI